MKFSIDYNIKPLANTLNMNDSMLAVGSCFAENMAAKMQENGFNIMLNPNGIVFNPHSIFSHLQDYVGNKNLTEEELVLHDGLWHSMQHHGSFSSADKAKLIANVNTQIAQAHNQLKQADWLFITLGSAWVYEYLPTQKKVTNNHKLSADLFNKKLLSIDELYNQFETVWQSIKQINPTIKMLWSVSPVRYVRDGLYENNISKSILHLLVHQIVNTNPTNCFYFPAYEIVIDELRDYRFYKEDLVHPNELAINYVWQKFTATCFDKNSIDYLNDFQKYNMLINHKPLHTDSVSYQKYKEQCAHLRDYINNKYTKNID
ncbi:MAG: GSCFA domain-containing protein [Bacteroidota bacterium]